MIDLFKNLAINLRATGPAAVMIAWIMAVAGIGILGQGELANFSLTILGFVGGAVMFSLASRA